MHVATQFLAQNKLSIRLFAAACALLACLLLAACSGANGTVEPIKLVVTPVASPTPTPHALPTVPPVTYKVKSGDTLSGIADMFGVTVDDIVRSNNIADPNSLSEGQTLTIPGRAPSPTPAANTSVTPSVAGGTPTSTPSSPSTPVLPPPDVTPPQGPTTPPLSP